MEQHYISMLLEMPYGARELYFQYHTQKPQRGYWAFLRSLNSAVIMSSREREYHGVQYADERLKHVSNDEKVVNSQASMFRRFFESSRQHSILIDISTTDITMSRSV
uniref:Uncharacterized protein n=1 Tax=Schistocephalus solidus TaxID=70667 RepID=A0A0X3PSE2_SCHSO